MWSPHAPRDAARDRRLCRKCRPGQPSPSPRASSKPALIYANVNSTDGDRVLVFLPALGTLLGLYEEAKGSPLTQEEVYAIRDNGVVVMMERADVAKLEEQRGHRDIDPEDCWNEWLEFRKAT